MKMKSKVVLLGICLLFFSLFKMNCNAAPKTMPDGTVFDAEFMQILIQMLKKHLEQMKKIFIIII